MSTYCFNNFNMEWDIILKTFRPRIVTISVYKSSGCSLDYFKYFTFVMYVRRNWKQNFRLRVTSVPGSSYVKESQTSD